MTIIFHVILAQHHVMEVASQVIVMGLILTAPAVEAPMNAARIRSVLLIKNAPIMHVCQDAPRIPIQAATMMMSTGTIAVMSGRRPMTTARIHLRYARLITAAGDIITGIAALHSATTLISSSAVIAAVAKSA